MYVETIRIAGIEKAVSRIALGTWSMGGHLWGGADDELSPVSHCNPALVEITAE